MTPPIPASARRALKRSIASGLWFVGRHMRGLCVNTCAQSPPIASIRSIAVSIPPDEETCAPSSIASLRYGRDGGQSSHGSEPDRTAAHRQRPDGALQLAL